MHSFHFGLYSVCRTNIDDWNMSWNGASLQNLPLKRFHGARTPSDCLASWSRELCSRTSRPSAPQPFSRCTRRSFPLQSTCAGFTGKANLDRWHTFFWLCFTFCSSLPWSGWSPVMLFIFPYLFFLFYDLVDHLIGEFDPEAAANLYLHLREISQ